MSLQNKNKYNWHPCGCWKVSVCKGCQFDPRLKYKYNKKRRNAKNFSLIILASHFITYPRTICRTIAGYETCGSRHSVPIKTLPSSTFRHCVLAEGYQNVAMKMLNISFTRMEIEPTTSRVYSRKLVPLRIDWPLDLYYNTNKNIRLSMYIHFLLKTISK